MRRDERCKWQAERRNRDQHRADPLARAPAAPIAAKIPQHDHALFHPDNHRRSAHGPRQVALGGARAIDACKRRRGDLKRCEYRDIEHGKTEGNGKETGIDLANEPIEALQGTTEHRKQPVCGGVVPLTTDLMLHRRGRASELTPANPGKSFVNRAGREGPRLPLAEASGQKIAAINRLTPAPMCGSAPSLKTTVQVIPALTTALGRTMRQTARIPRNFASYSPIQGIWGKAEPV
jgi:hypothetical protein